jgi:methyl-accepting chemotaxis protein
MSASALSIERGVDLVGRTGAALALIRDQVSNINTVVTDIAAGAEAQAIGLLEVNTAMGQMDHATQENAGIAEESTEASRAIAQEAAELAKLVGSFVIAEGQSRQRLASQSRRNAA